MIQFTALRLYGFKSFVDRTELEIGPGLNGIVGPNGCGKSNLVEALRWVMGENSAKRMRGGGMEDVIFAGTSKRTARNIAEVSLLLDNQKRTAPAAYNGGDELEVTRRIERDHGSSYKINSRNVRARDVQMLFADTVTGANSPALVSQGRVTQIINAKPLERRLILEESAGIAGLYARRHEAELRLKAADANLLRIEDITGSMESRLSGLKRQARQAARYRNINAQIRQLEILIAWLEWRNLEERLEKTKKEFSAAESIVGEKLGTVTQLTRTQTTQAQDLPALRKAEAERAAALQTLKIALQRLDEDQARLDQQAQETETQLRQARADYEHEKQSLQESSSLLERLEKEQKTLIAEQEGEQGKLEVKNKARKELERTVEDLETQYTALMQSAAEARAQRKALEQQLAGNRERLEIVESRLNKAREDLEKAKGKAVHGPDIREIAKEIAALENKSRELAHKIQAGNEAVQKEQNRVTEARAALTEAENKKSKIETEIKTLKSFFEQDNEEKYAPVLSCVTAEQGFETALARAMGDSLMASLEEDAPALWLKLPPAKAGLPALPAGAKPLLPHIKAPPELQRALSQIGLAESEKEGRALAAELHPGQALVSKDGTYWRWDGYCVRSTAKDRHSLHLEQKNKLRELEKILPNLQELIGKAQKAFETAETGLDEKRSDLESRQHGLKLTELDLTEKRMALAALKEEQARRESEIANLENGIALFSEDAKTLEASIRRDRDTLKVYEQASDGEKSRKLAEVQDSLARAREAHSQALRAFDLYQQQHRTRQARMQAIADERISLQNRAIRSRERIRTLEERIRTLEEKQAQMKDRPGDFESRKQEALNRISESESRRNEAACKLESCEREVQETSAALKAAEHVLGEAREERARAQATLSAIQEQMSAMAGAIREQFDLKAEDLIQHAAINPEKTRAEDLDHFRGQKEKLARERESIGPVNLRADDEAQALEKELTTLLHERNDLMQAVGELRGGIRKINKEARERLLSAFEHVNAHFQTLFVRLFGGGKAHLALIDSPDNSNDPLGAGLEIFAQPPGKALQSLSLLSGGEQTLASIALIFAMFLTNPSPVCVLDEIDAPLDDANVDRVCDLLEDIAERGETRFLIITHHRLTMARMDRLYGVTMAEQGVSQLVSVDLQQSFDFLEAA